MKPQSDFQPETAKDLGASIATDTKLGKDRGGVVEVFGGTTIILKPMNGVAITYANLPDYWQSPGRFEKILAGSAATQIVAYY